MNEISMIILVIGIILLPVLFFYILYLISMYVYSALFISVKKGIVLSFFSIFATFFPNLILPASNHIQLFTIGSWQISIHPIGLVFPILISISLLIRSNQINWSFLFLSLIPVCIMAYLMTTPVLEKGIVAPFPLWLFPPFMAAMIVVLNKEKLKDNTCLYAFTLGVFGVILGADLSHFPELLSYPLSSSMHAIIGGASGLDLIFLSGMISVLFSKLFLSFFETKTEAQDINKIQTYM
jgi:hypothetical protein